MKIININGKATKWDGDIISYAEIILTAGYNLGDIVSVTWSHRFVEKMSMSGIIIPGQSVAVYDGMIINAIVTSKT